MNVLVNHPSLTPAAIIEPSPQQKRIAETKALIDRYDGDGREIGRRLEEELQGLTTPQMREYLRTNYGKSYEWARHRIREFHDDSFADTRRAKNREHQAVVRSYNKPTEEDRIVAQIKEEAAEEAKIPRNQLLNRKALLRYIRAILELCPKSMSDDDIRQALDEALKDRPNV